MLFPRIRTLLLLAATCTSPAAEVASLVSPDGTNRIAVHLDENGAPAYRVFRKDRQVIGDSPLGLRGDPDFSRGLKLESAGEMEIRQERYELFAGIRPRVDQPHHRRSLVFRNGSGERITLDLNAGNEGVAFRYRFSEHGAERTIDEELSGFRLPPEAKGWISPYNSSSDSSPAYEDYYFAVKPGDPPPPSRGGPTRGWYFPALFQTPDAWMLLTESGTDANYCGCHLAADSTGGLYRIAFPFPDESTRGVKHPENVKPRHTLPWTMPWRVIVLGDTAGDILLSTLVTDLAPPSEIADTTWIAPGRASWAWWAYPDGPADTALFARFIDAAAERGWEHSLLDAGWWKADTRELADLGTRKKTALHFWSHANDFYDTHRRSRKLDGFARMGAAGVKIDFWCSDRQETMTAMTETLREAAKRRIMVNFHGCTLPRGWHRTWPNLMTVEAVLGAESYMFDQRFPEKAAELNTILPFTRNVAGPMDYTPLGLAEKRYRRLTTAAHELAASIVFTSGIVHYADDPETYTAFPAEARAILRDAPARWDETRCLIGEPGRVVVLARRSGSDWFIAGLNGTSAEIPVTLDLSPFGKSALGTLVHESGDMRMELAATPSEPSATWRHTLPARGGFVLRLVEPPLSND